jgi:hypothetical protein
MGLSLQYKTFIFLGLFIGLLSPQISFANSPNIQSRNTWATADDNTYTLNNWPPNSNNTFQVKRVLLHDTAIASFNSDALDPRQIIRSIFTTHARNNGWGDIGYNYIIARDGTVYQGRMGSNGIRAAHLYVNRTGDNFNYQSIGVSLIGRYGSGYATAPEAMKQSLAKLSGWLSSVNSIAPTDFVTEPVWNFYTKAYSSNYTGFRLTDHGAVEAGNGDTNMVDMSWLRNRALEWKQYYDNSVYRDDNGRLYTIRNGIKEITANAGGKNIISINSTELALFPENTNIRTFPNGSLLRTDTGVGYLENGSIRPLVNPDVFNSRFKWKDVLDVTRAEWNSYVLSPALTLREGMLVRERNNPDVYVITNQQRRYIPSPVIFEALGYKWSNITIIPDGTLAISHPIGPVMQSSPYPDGTLLVNRDNPTGIEVLEAGKRRPIPSPEIFDTQYNYKDLVYVSSSEWNSYPQGPAVYFRDGVILRATGRSEVYIMSNGQKRYVNSPTVFEGLGYKWNNIIVVSPEGIDSVPIGAPITDSML